MSQPLLGVRTKRYDPDSLEDSFVDVKRFRDVTLRLGRQFRALGYDSDKNDSHAYQCQSTCFSELLGCQILLPTSI